MYKHFHGVRFPQKNFDGILYTFLVLVIWNEIMHIKKKNWSTNSLLHLWLATIQLLVNYMHAKQAKNTVGMYCNSKDRQFIGHWAESCHAENVQIYTYVATEIDWDAAQEL